MELKTGDCVADLLGRYEINGNKAHMIVINRRKGDTRTILKDGDHVRVLPLAAGG